MMLLHLLLLLAGALEKRRGERTEELAGRSVVVGIDARRRLEHVRGRVVGAVLRRLGLLGVGVVKNEVVKDLLEPPAPRRTQIKVVLVLVRIDVPVAGLLAAAVELAHHQTTTIVRTKETRPCTVVMVVVVEWSGQTGLSVGRPLGQTPPLMSLGRA